MVCGIVSVCLCVSMCLCRVEFGEADVGEVRSFAMGWSDRGSDGTIGFSVRRGFYQDYSGVCIATIGPVCGY